MTPDLVVFAAGLAGISLTSVGYGLHAHDPRTHSWAMTKFGVLFLVVAAVGVVVTLAQI